jgi:basic membrane protein A
MRASSLALAALLAPVLLASTGGSANAQPQLRVGYVTFAGNVPSERELFGVPLLGFMRAVKQFDVQGRVVYVPPNQDQVGALESLARQRYDLIILGLPVYGPEGEPTSVDIVARKFPRVKFLLPDTSVDTLFRPRPNVQGTVFHAEQAGYLAGYLAALMEGRRAGRDVVSSVGGYKIWGVDRWIVGYNAGARKADPGVTRLTGYSWDFAVPEKCRTIALSQIARGSGVVFNVAGGCGLGAVGAAKEHDVWAVGVDVDQSFLGRHVLTSAVIKYEKPIVEAIRRLVQGTFTTGGDTVYNLRNGGVGLGKISPSVPPALLRRLAEVRRQIVAGEIEVPLVSRK